MRREIHSNYRLTVTPNVHPGNRHDVMRSLLDDMAAAIRRHVDHVGTVTTQWETRAVCSFCGREWEVVTAEDLAERPEDYEGDVVGQPVCCDRAIAEFLCQTAKAGGA